VNRLQLHWLISAGTITLIVVGAIVVVKVLHRVIDKMTDRMARGPKKQRTKKQQEIARRREQRAKAIGSVLDSSVTIFVSALTVLLVLGELGVNLAPVLASAGVAGIALGFGAQELVRDFMSGIAMIMEDQYGVGDYVKFSTADDDGIWVEGTIELVALRTTKIRDADGLVWYVRNGEVQKVGNQSQGAALAPEDDVK
jgi:small-conductance mechanosensitive channel